MKVRTIGVLSLVGLAMSVGPVWAGPVGTERTFTVKQQVTLNQLEARREQIGRQMPEPPKPGPIGLWISKRRQLDDLIDRLKSGQPISPHEIDQAMQPASPLIPLLGDQGTR